MNKDNKYMRLALKEAEKAYQNNEVPVGCVIVYQDKVIAKGYNKREQKQNPLGHAEIIAIQKACKKLQTWKLEEATIYITLEPCLMCAGAILNTRIKRIVFATTEPKFGVLGSVTNVFDHNRFNHQIDITSGVMQEEASALLKRFFQELRKTSLKQKN